MASVLPSLRLCTRLRSLIAIARSFRSLRFRHPFSSASQPVARALAWTDDPLLDAPDSIWAVERLGKGRWFAASDRKEGRIPGYVYENDTSAPAEHVLIVMDKYQILNLWLKFGQKRFLRTVFTLEVYDGMGSSKVLYREPVVAGRVNFDTSGEVCNLGFMRAPPSVKLRLDSPVRISGVENCVGLRKGGRLKTHSSHISFFCLPQQLPLYVEVKIDNLDIGDKIIVGDIYTDVPLHSRQPSSLPICEIVDGEAT